MQGRDRVGGRLGHQRKGQVTDPGPEGRGQLRHLRRHRLRAALPDNIGEAGVDLQQDGDRRGKGRLAALGVFEGLAEA